MGVFVTECAILVFAARGGHAAQFFSLKSWVRTIQMQRAVLRLIYCTNIKTTVKRKTSGRALRRSKLLTDPSSVKRPVGLYRGQNFWRTRQINSGLSRKPCWIAQYFLTVSNVKPLVGLYGCQNFLTLSNKHLAALSDTERQVQVKAHSR